MIKKSWSTKNNSKFEYHFFFQIGKISKQFIYFFPVYIPKWVASKLALSVDR